MTIEVVDTFVRKNKIVMNKVSYVYMVENVVYEVGKGKFNVNGIHQTYLF